MAVSSVATRKRTSDLMRLVGCCSPWSEAYTAGVGSPLEMMFLREFKKHAFLPEKQVPIPDPAHSISIAGFAVPEKRLAVYIDGSAFNVGVRLRRDRWIRERLRNGVPPWTVVELRVGDLKDMEMLIQEQTGS